MCKLNRLQDIFNSKLWEIILQSYMKDIKMYLKLFYLFNQQDFRCYCFTARVIKCLEVKCLMTYLNFKVLYWFKENMESKFHNLYIRI